MRYMGTRDYSGGYPTLTGVLLIAGIVLAFYIWASIGSKKAAKRNEQPEPVNYDDYDGNALDRILGYKEEELVGDTAEEMFNNAFNK